MPQASFGSGIATSKGSSIPAENACFQEHAVSKCQASGVFQLMQAFRLNFLLAVDRAAFSFATCLFAWVQATFERPKLQQLNPAYTLCSCQAMCLQFSQCRNPVYSHIASAGTGHCMASCDATHVSGLGVLGLSRQCVASVHASWLSLMMGLQVAQCQGEAQIPLKAS